MTQAEYFKGRGAQIKTGNRFLKKEYVAEHLEGLEGTWHRLWGIISLAFGFGDDIETDEGVAAVRIQFEELLGRTMTSPEWATLVAHAKNHHETVVKPSMAKGDTDKS